MSFLDIIFAILIFIFLLFSRPLKETEQGFNRDTTASLRGLAVLGIILHHIHNFVKYRSPILSPVGYLATGLFLFISGYGNALSINKENADKPIWLFRKIIKVYIPFLVVYFINHFALAFIDNSNRPNLAETLEDIRTVSLPNQESWFPKVIILYFLIHWTVKKVFRKTLLQNIVILVFTLFFIEILHGTRHGDYWYNTILCYAIGCIYAKPVITKKLLNILRNNKVFSFLLCSIAFYYTINLTNEKPHLKFLCALLFSLACYYLTFIFKYKTRIFSWIGIRSFEFYLFHVVGLQLFPDYRADNHYLYALCVMASTFILVFPYLFIKSKLLKSKFHKVA